MNFLISLTKPQDYPRSCKAFMIGWGQVGLSRDRWFDLFFVAPQFQLCRTSYPVLKHFVVGLLWNCGSVPLTTAMPVLTGKSKTKKRHFDTTLLSVVRLAIGN